MNMCVADETILAYIDGGLEAAQREEVAAHLGICDGCADRVAALAARHRRVDALLADLATDSPEETPSVALARFRARAGARRGAAGAAPSLGGVPVKVAVRAAIAAVVLALAVVGTWRLTRPDSESRAAEPSRGATPRVLSTAKPPEMTQPAPDAVPRSSTVAGRTSVPGLARKTPRAVPSGAYYLLTSDATPPEVGMVVRVRMRVSALTAAVIVQRGANADAEVEADVLVGQDGRARAIRFVNQRQTSGGR